MFAAAVIVLRLASAAPDGTSWAREFRAFERDVEAHTRGEVKIKWYLNGIAGEELVVAERIERGQLDGTGSGGPMCLRLSPTMRVTRLQGVFDAHDEVSFVINRFREQIDTEMGQKGMVFLGGPVIGREVVMSRDPVTSFAQLKALKMWRWNVDLDGIAWSRAAGMNIVPTGLNEAATEYEAGKIDALIALPASALAFQWSTRVKHLLDQPHGYLAGCLVISQRSWDRLTPEQRQIVRSDGAKAIARLDEISRDMDARLLGGLFQKQGLVVAKPTDPMNKEFLAAARAARSRPDAPVPAALLKKVEDLLTEKRAARPR
jgi:TRAP-type C4-dicarboxylate transport system substrate-binding protein